MSDTEKLTTDQKISIAELATQLYIAENPSGHSRLAPRKDEHQERRSLSEMESAAQQYWEQRTRDEFRHLYAAIEGAILGSPDTQR